jgi:hypothetical protein
MIAISRRIFLGLLPAVLRPPSRAADSVAPPQWAVHHFQAHAVILLLGVPVYRRRDVGGAWFRIAESAGPGHRLVHLQFAAGSLPSRAAGLNRLGYLEEEVRIGQSDGPWASYFGAMTASKEETYDEARKAVATQGAAAQIFVAMRGEIRRTTMRNCTANVSVEHPVGWPDVGALVSKCRDRLASLPNSEAPSQSATTFLYALYSAMQSGKERVTPFLHSGKQYILRARVRPDPKQGREFHRQGMAGEAASVHLLDGQIHAALAGGRPGPQTSSFQLWFDQAGADPKPLRFDLKPRAFLRLSFERQPARSASASSGQSAGYPPA